MAGMRPSIHTHGRTAVFGGDCVYATQAHIVAHLLDGAPLETGSDDYLRNVEIEESDLPIRRRTAGYRPVTRAG